MYLINKNKDSIINLDKIVNIFIGADSLTLKANFLDKSGCQLAKYNSKEETIIALELLFENFNKNIYKVPNENEIKTRILSNEKRSRHIKGKKTKGHGGS